MTLSPAQRRILVLVVAALGLQVLFTFCAVPLYARSERLHATVLALWLLDFLFWQRHHKASGRGVRIVVGAGIAFGLAASFWNILEWQARSSGSRADIHEVLWRLGLVASLFILYSLWSRALSWLLERNRRVREWDASPRARPWLRALRPLCAIAIFAPYLFTSLNSHRYKLGNAVTPRSAFGLPFRDVAFRTADGVPLRGWLIPAQSADRAVIVCHGLGANKGMFLGVAPFLQRAGKTLLMFDYRGHGDSRGHTVNFV
jgi:hypothetical protein